jgi:hypothetical protein
LQPVVVSQFIPQDAEQPRAFAGTPGKAFAGLDRR